MILSLCLCHFTYFLILSSSRPTVLTQYPLDQKCRPQYLLFSSWCISKILIALLPFKKPMVSDTEYFGGIESTKCIWSSCTLPSKISIFFHSHSCLIIVHNDLLMSPLNILNLYLGHQTIWYLHCHTACANLLKSDTNTSFLLLGSPPRRFTRRYSFFTNLHAQHSLDHLQSRWFKPINEVNN